MHLTSIRTALASAFQIPPRTSILPRPRTLPQPSLSNRPSRRASFSTTPAQPAKKGGPVRIDRRITLIRFFLHHPASLTPRPLRFSRNRALRHWTIHRAWNLYRSKARAARQLELEKQYTAMAAANEELRTGAGDGGRLFRMAQMKTGVWSIPERGGGVPIEYSRGLVEWVGSTGGLGGGGSEGVGVGSKAKIWDGEWKR